MNNKIKLFCIPGGGASAVVYLKWCRYLRNDIKVCMLELPGRGLRRGESELESFNDVTEDIYKSWEKQMSPEFDDDYMIIGYSFGAIAAYELYRKIADKGLKKPMKVYINASDSPDGKIYTVPFFNDPERKPQVKELLKRYFPEHIFQNRSMISDFSENYIEELYKLYSVHGKIMPVDIKSFNNVNVDDFELKKCVEFANDTLRVLDNDISLADEYQSSEREYIKMNCDVTVFAGEDDTMTPIEALKGWKRVCDGKFTIITIPGGHQAMIDDPEKIIQIINGDVDMFCKENKR